MDFFAEISWWIPAILAMAGIGLLVAGNNRLDRTMKLAGLGLLLAGVVLGVVSYLLESDREIVVRQTRELLASAGSRDWKKFQSLLDPKVQVFGQTGSAAITAAVRVAAEQFDLQKVRLISTVETQAETNRITTRFSMLAEGGNGTVKMGWELVWEKAGGQWLLFEAIPLGGPGISQEMIESGARGLK